MPPKEGKSAETVPIYAVPAAGGSMMPGWSFLIGALTVLGAHRRSSSSPETPGQPAPFRWIECPEAAAQVQLGTTVVIDVRGPDEFAGPLGHIAGAINLPIHTLSSCLGDLEHLKEKPILLVCHTDKRSSTAASILSSGGFRSVSVLRGGMVRWKSQGLPVGTELSLHDLMKDKV